MSTTYESGRSQQNREVFEVSEAWIRRHRTRAGGWTRRALAVLRVGWPPPTGWIRRVIGMQLTQDERHIFEAEGRRRQPQQNRLFESQP